ncbi:MAG: hypothetical protein ABEJ03_00470 [Candidatus Nanohaloarchaea archaeon]
MTDSKLDYSSFESGDAQFDELLELLCESPDKVRDQLNEYDEKLQDKGIVLRTSPQEKDLNRAFGITRILSDFLGDEAKEILAHDSYIKGRPNEISFYVEEDLETLKNEFNDPLVDVLTQKGESKITYEDVRINVIFDQPYEVTEEIPTQYENIEVHMPSRESVLKKIHDNLQEYSNMMDRAKDLPGYTDI